MPDTPPGLALVLLPERLAVCKLPADAAVPSWAVESRTFSCVTRTADELSVLTVESRVPAEQRAERGFRAFKVRGPLPFDLIGVLAAITAPLAEAGVSIFALSTYDTDYVLVKERDLPTARAALAGAGHTIVE